VRGIDSRGISDTRGINRAAEHAAENCSLVYAGGCMAIEAALLPYRKEEAPRAITRCFRDTLETARNDDDPLLRTKRLLRSWLRSVRVVELKTSNDRFDANRYQGYAIGVGQRRRYVVRAASMRMWLSGQPGGFRDVVLWLERQRRLQPRQSRAAVDRPADWMERNVIWPARSGGPPDPVDRLLRVVPGAGPQRRPRADAIGRRIRPGRRGGAEAIFSPCESARPVKPGRCDVADSGRRVGDESSAAIDRRDYFRPFETGDEPMVASPRPHSGETLASG
jgi:hypothetical protein